MVIEMSDFYREHNSWLGVESKRKLVNTSVYHFLRNTYPTLVKAYSESTHKKPGQVDFSV